MIEALEQALLAAARGDATEAARLAGGLRKEIEAMQAENANLYNEAIELNGEILRWEQAEAEASRREDGLIRRMWQMVTSDVDRTELLGAHRARLEDAGVDPYEPAPARSTHP